LGDDDLVSGDEASGGGAGRFHESFPVAAAVVAGVSSYESGGFGGADGFVRAALGEEGEDGLLKGSGGFLSAELFFAWGGVAGFGFSVGHGRVVG
jgi:hypothetical protein